MIEKSEFIGKKLIIKDSSDKSLVGAQGAVIDETKNTITILEDGKRRTFIKDTIRFTIDGKRIDGKTVSLRPEERIKRSKKR